MLEDFLSRNRATLIARCRAKVAARRAPRAAEQELGQGIPRFLDHLIDALRQEGQGAARTSDLAAAAAQHGHELFRRGFTAGQIVHAYGDLRQVITDLALEQDAAVTVSELRTLNRCLDNAVADAVTELGRRRDEFASSEHRRSTNERLGYLAHELRNLIHRATLAVATIKQGKVGIWGATGALLDRSLIALSDLIDRSLVEVRLTAGLSERREPIRVADFVAEVQIGATIEAATRDLEFIGSPIDKDLAVEGDRQILAAALANVLQNAVKFTRPHGRVTLEVHAMADRILISVADECGGLPEGKEEEIFRPFQQIGAERTGLGLGLPISRRGVEANAGKLYVRNLPGTGCVFIIDLPRADP
jgi:signal transduction histidine kinase